MSELSNKILQSIKDNKILPIPKWQILLRNRVIISLAIVGTVLGVISIAVLLHIWFSPFESTGQSGIFSLLENIPFLWIFVMILFMLIAYHNFIHTDGGYRWKTLKILIAAVACSIIVGMALFLGGIGRVINSSLLSTVPGYAQFGDLRGRRWMSVEAGRLAGRVISIQSTTSFILRDIYGEIWNVKVLPEEDSIQKVTTGSFVRILGDQESEGVFKASEIIEWEGRGKGMQGNGNRQRIHR